MTTCGAVFAQSLGRSFRPRSPIPSAIMQRLRLPTVSWMTRSLPRVPICRVTVVTPPDSFIDIVPLNDAPRSHRHALSGAWGALTGASVVIAAGTVAVVEIVAVVETVAAGDAVDASARTPTCAAPSDAVNNVSATAGTRRRLAG